MEFDGKVFFSTVINAGILAYIIGMLYSLRSYLWCKVEGEITKSELSEEYDDGVMYKPIIEYIYKYKNKEYTNDYIAFAIPSTNSKSSAEHYLTYFGSGWKVNVYVNPKQPEKSVLARGIRYQNVTLLIILIFVTYFWVPVGWAMWQYIIAL